MKNLVSIIVPVYNTSSYLERCFDSILAQNYENIELIVIDDGSTDTSVETVLQYRKEKKAEKKIKLFCCEHGGAGYARNKGMEKAQGEYICFVDSDDYVLPTYVSEMMSLADGRDIVICGRRTIEGDFEKINAPQQRENVSGEEHLLDIIRKKENAFLAVCKLYRREMLEKNAVYFAEGIRFEDMVFSFSSAAVSEAVAYCKDTSYVYCVRQGSQSEQVDERLFLDYLQAIALVMEDIVKAGKLAALRESLHFYLLEALYRTNLWLMKEGAEQSLDVFRKVSRYLSRLIREVKLAKEPEIAVIKVLNDLKNET